jgi:4'-phosphopantetheinyl transferase
VTMASVHWATPSEVARDDEAEALLSASEIERMRRFRQPADRDRVLVAWSLARRVLGELLGVDPRELAFDRTCDHCADPRHGKPKLVAGGPDFSLSHAGDRVVLAVLETERDAGAGRIGVDVEVVERDIDELAPMILHPSEPVVAGVDLLRVWVRKEAVIKASGHGLVRPMTSFSVTDATDVLDVRDLVADDGYVAALAVLDARRISVDLPTLSEKPHRR